MTETVAAYLPGSWGQAAVQLLLAAVLGGTIGWERELHEKAAGLRTNLLICVGAALFTQLSAHVAGLGSLTTPADPTRIASQVVSGIGFLGAGAIIQSRARVRGLTTAATIWIVAAIGMGVGAGAYLEAVLATVVVLLTLTALGFLERKIRVGWVRLQVEVAVPDGRDGKEGLDQVKAALEELGLSLTLRGATKAPDGEETRVRFLTRTSRKSLEATMAVLFELPFVREVRPE